MAGAVAAQPARQPAGVSGLAGRTVSVGGAGGGGSHACQPKTGPDVPTRSRTWRLGRGEVLARRRPTWRPRDCVSGAAPKEDCCWTTADLVEQAGGLCEGRGPAEPCRAVTCACLLACLRAGVPACPTEPRQAAGWMGLQQPGLQPQDTPRCKQSTTSCANRQRVSSGAWGKEAPNPQLWLGRPWVGWLPSCGCGAVGPGRPPTPRPCRAPARSLSR